MSAILVACLSACADSDLTPAIEGPSIRETRQGDDMRALPPTFELDAAPDLTDPSDAASPDAEPPLDAASDQADLAMTPDQGDCPTGPSCVLGATTCRGPGHYATCMRDVSGCPGFGPQVPCPGAQMCAQDLCQGPPECLDQDLDGYGVDCPAGPDCDDNDPSRHPGQMELCDGLDNDCDQQIDEQDVCLCGVDPREPNDSLSSASPLALDSPTWNYICSSDQDFYALPAGLVNGGKYAVMLAYPVLLGDLQLRLYIDGVAGVTTQLSGSDHAGIRFTYDAAKTYAFEVIHHGAAAETFYRVNLLIEDSACTTTPDFFEHNDTIGTASLFFANWRTRAFVCDDEEDWYFLGEMMSGDTFTVEGFFEAGFFDPGGDVDFELFDDPDGDNIYSLVDWSYETGDDETLTHTPTHTGFYYLRVYTDDGISNSYELLITN